MGECPRGASHNLDFLLSKKKEVLFPNVKKIELKLALPSFLGTAMGEFRAEMYAPFKVFVFFIKLCYEELHLTRK